MNDLYVAIVNQLDNGIILLDEQLNIQLWNKWLVKYTGKSEEVVKGLPITTVVPRFDKNIYAYMFEKALLDKQKSFCSAAMHQYFVENKSGKMKPTRQNILIQHIQIEHTSYLMIELYDVSNHYKRIQNLNKHLKSSIDFSKNLEHFVYYDSLTNLPNRKFVLDRLERLIEEEVKVFSLFFIDLNGFKAVNDQYGHLQGDLLLQMFAERCKQFTQKREVFARLGGDEFVLLVEHMTTANEVERYTAKIHELLQEPFIIEGQQIVISASIGCARFPQDGATAKQLLNVADYQMYLQKAKKKHK
ncbi:diguanylate cyclase [Lysinibacillus xylanilyticus]|uniref:diguanylate cyclase domain-containing protein n=1 Tax=Lysinibacillus xylanilyticus TaxID=582475 RepID=UPI002B247C10|nr:diguanylate cyclase [Lysinibacillus xylanilyticus]MEB2301121.1 diguanylate cyclase [Lysinibacillus xylanilyticus]